MGTHPIFESDFDCLTEMEAEAWKALKQAAIRFELKTGLNVHVSACRGERPVYEFTSSGKTSTDSRLVSRQSRSQTDRSDFIPMSMPVHHPALYHSKDIILESKRELPDENENTEVKASDTIRDTRTITGRSRSGYWALVRLRKNSKNLVLTNRESRW